MRKKMQNLIIFWITNNISDAYYYIIDHLLNGTEPLIDLPDELLEQRVKVLYRKELEVFETIEELSEWIRTPDYVELSKSDRARYMRELEDVA